MNWFYVFEKHMWMMMCLPYQTLHIDREVWNNTRDPPYWYRCLNRLSFPTWEESKRKKVKSGWGSVLMEWWDHILSRQTLDRHYSRNSLWAIGFGCLWYASWNRHGRGGRGGRPGRRTGHDPANEKTRREKRIKERRRRLNRDGEVITRD